eukprot:7046873-Prymnesium_polylepis.1
MVQAPSASGSVWQRLDVWMSGTSGAFGQRLANVWPTFARWLDHILITSGHGSNLGEGWNAVLGEQ